MANTLRSGRAARTVLFLIGVDGIKSVYSELEGFGPASRSARRVLVEFGVLRRSLHFGLRLGFL